MTSCDPSVATRPTVDPLFGEYSSDEERDPIKRLCLNPTAQNANLAHLVGRIPKTSQIQ